MQPDFNIHAMGGVHLSMEYKSAARDMNSVQIGGFMENGTLVSYTETMCHGPTESSKEVQGPMHLDLHTKPGP
jgi:hypothetical protein